MECIQSIYYGGRMHTYTTSSTHAETKETIHTMHIPQPTIYTSTASCYRHEKSRHGTWASTLSYAFFHENGGRTKEAVR
jgi:hypothetical protein